MEISSLILPSLLRQCSHQVINRAVLSEDARIRAQDSTTARTSIAWPFPTGLISEHLPVLACIFKSWMQISFIFFLEFALLQGINCSIMWAPAFALCNIWLPHRLVNVSLHLAQGQRCEKGLSLDLTSFLGTNKPAKAPVVSNPPGGAGTAPRWGSVHKNSGLTESKRMRLCS